MHVKNGIRWTGDCRNIQWPYIIQPVVFPTTMNHNTRFILVIENGWRFSSFWSCTSFWFDCTPIVSISNFINIDNESFIYILRINSFSSFFKRTNGTSKDEVFPRWNGMTDNTYMIPFRNLVGYFWVDPFIFRDIVHHGIGVLWSKWPSTKN